MSRTKMAFYVETARLDAHGSRALQAGGNHTGHRLSGNPNVFNPAELLLAALSACIVKGIERITPMLSFSLRGVEVKVDGIRLPPGMESITSEIVVDTDESDRRLDHVKKFGAVFNTVAPGTQLVGIFRRKA